MACRHINSQSLPHRVINQLRVELESAGKSKDEDRWVSVLEAMLIVSDKNDIDLD